MSNPLPVGAIPKLFRMRNKEGREVGAYYIKIRKKAVNLRTQNYFKARDHAQEAMNGQRTFSDDRYFDDASPDTVVGGSIPPPATPSNGDWAADATRAASASIEPDAYFPKALPPIPKPAEDDWDKPPTTEGAPATPPDGAKGPGIADESTSLPPEMLDNLVRQIAATVVELQIQGQEYLAIRWGKFQPGTVPPDSKARELPTAIWKAQIKKWIPPDVPLPAWIVAPVLCAMLTIPVQLEGATPLRKPDITPES